MVHLRYSMALLLAIGLLAVGGLGGYFLHDRNHAAGDREPGTEVALQDALPSEEDKGTPAPALRDPAANKRPAPTRAPVVVGVSAAYPGAAAEEVELQVTIPLEVTLSGMPHLESVRSESLPGFCRLHTRFSPDTDYQLARQEVINRLATIPQPLPKGVFPQIAPMPGRTALRYLLTGPRDRSGRPVYASYDLRALQDWLLVREFRLLPGVADVHSTGGTVRRYEVQADPDRLRRYGITLTQLKTALMNSKVTVGGEYLNQGGAAVLVRSVGTVSDGADPLSAKALTASDPETAAGILRAAEKRQLRDIRNLVIAVMNKLPIRVEDVVEGGRLAPGEDEGKRGVMVGSLPRVNTVNADGSGSSEGEEAVQGIVLLGPDADPRLAGVRTRIRELNSTAGKLLPGVRIEPFYTTADAGKGALWVYGTFPIGTSVERAGECTRKVREVLRQVPEVGRVVWQVGRSQANGDMPSLNQAWFFVGLKAGPARTRVELVKEIDHLLLHQVPGAAWLTTAQGPEELELAFPGVLAGNLLKIMGPDLGELERLANVVETTLRNVPGVENVAAHRCLGLAHLEFRVDAQKCAKWGVMIADVNQALSCVLGGRIKVSLEGEEERSDIAVTWPSWMRESEASILDIPVDIINNPVSKQAAADSGLAPPGAIDNSPRLRLRDLVSPIIQEGEPDSRREFARSGAAAIYREQGKRVLPVRFTVRGRPLADIQAEAAKKIAPTLKSPYRIEWDN